MARCRARGLRCSSRLLGLERDEAVALLGEPGPGRSAELDEWDLVYWVAPEPHGLLDAESRWLALKLDEEGRVVETRVVVAIREPPGF